MNTAITPRTARRRAPWAVGITALALVAALAGCGGPATASSGPPPPPASSGAQATGTPAPEVNPAGDIPDNQVYVPYTAPDGSFTVSVPEGWARTDQGGSTVFRDKLNSVRIDSAPRPAPLDVATARAVTVPRLQATVPGFALGDVSTVERSAGQAVLVTYTATSAPDPVTGHSTVDSVERYAFWHGGQEVVLTLSGPRGADNVDPWRTITDSLTWHR